MQLPAHANRPEVFHLDEQDPVSTVFSPGVISAEKVCENILHLDLDTQILVLEKIKQIEAEIQYQHETQQIRKQIEQERQDEQHLLAFVHSDFKKRQEDRQWVYQIEFDITDDIVTSGNPFMYVKRILESKNTEVSYRQLTPEDIPLFDEAKAKDVAEVLGSLALRAIQTEEERQDAISHPERHLPMRWVLTWKPVIPPEPPERGKPTTLVKDGSKKAKARVVLLGFRHPDLINDILSLDSLSLELQHLLLAELAAICYSNVLLLMNIVWSLLTRNLPSSKLIIAKNPVESGPRAVPELARAHNVQPGALLRVLGAIYGLTNAPRIFWKDVDCKLQSLGAIPHPMDRCIWIFKDPKGKFAAEWEVKLMIFL